MFGRYIHGVSGPSYSRRIRAVISAACPGRFIHGVSGPLYWLSMPNRPSGMPSSPGTRITAPLHPAALPARTRRRMPLQSVKICRFHRRKKLARFAAQNVRRGSGTPAVQKNNWGLSKSNHPAGLRKQQSYRSTAGLQQPPAARSTVRRKAYRAEVWRWAHRVAQL